VTLREQLAVAICNANLGGDVANEPEKTWNGDYCSPRYTGRKRWAAFLPEADAVLAVLEVANHQNINLHRE
jgi:hypothetical protein